MEDCNKNLNYRYSVGSTCISIPCCKEYSNHVIDVDSISMASCKNDYIIALVWAVSVSVEHIVKTSLNFKFDVDNISMACYKDHLNYRIDVGSINMACCKEYLNYIIDVGSISMVCCKEYLY